jgi:hypothetical protein
MIATHVDDLKCCTDPVEKLRLIAGLEKSFGKLKIQAGEFDHCGIKHTQTAAGITMCQDAYAQQLRPIDTAGMNITDVNTLLDIAQTHIFMSLLGGLAWLIQTRCDFASMCAPYSG